MIFLSMGSNLSSPDGSFNRFENIDSAIKILLSFGYELIKKSNFYETPSYPNESEPKFINVAISLKNKNINISDEDSVRELMRKIILIENKYGRKRTKKNEPRCIDIDIIDCNGKIIEFKLADSTTIKVPHERLSMRNFVLFPLQEISPDWIHPLSRKNINQLIDELSEIDKKSILKVQHT